MKWKYFRKEMSDLTWQSNIDDRLNTEEKYRQIKERFKLNDSKIKKLLNDWHTFTEIMEWWFEWNKFIPKNIIISEAEIYLTTNTNWFQYEMTH